MDVVFAVVLNVLLIGALVVFVVAVAGLVMSAQDPLERALRAAAVFCGALVVIGGQASGLSYADFVVKALADNATMGVSLVAAVVPATAGALLGFYIVRASRKSDVLTVRVLAFVGMLATAQFAAVYVTAINQQGAQLGKTALPNISFVVAILFVLVLKWKPDEDRRGANAGSGIMSRLTGWVANKIPGGEPAPSKGRLQ